MALRQCVFRPLNSAFAPFPQTPHAFQIRKAYKTLARKLHPDRNKASDATEKFIQLANAYEILSNEESRKGD